MIRVERGAEPPELRLSRKRHLARAMLSLAVGEKVTFEGYDVEVEDVADARHTVKKRLFRRQHQKCAYCERSGGDRGQPVEHMRPKGGADRGDPRTDKRGVKVDAQHYWWLAWSWDNLVFACTSCNASGAKGTWFPLAPGSASLKSPDVLRADLDDAAFDTTREAAMLLDPTRDNPLDHIVWLPTNPAEVPEKFLWEPRDKGSVRGAITIQALGLRHTLPDQVTEHIRSNIWVAWLRDVVAHPEKPRARERWAEMSREKLLPSQPFTAASYDALCWLRKHFALPPGDFPLQPPGTAAPTASIGGAQIEGDPLMLAAMPDVVRLKVRAERHDARAVIELLLPHRSWQELELANAAGLAVGTVKSVLRALKNSGKAAKTASGWTTPSPPSP